MSPCFYADGYCYFELGGFLNNSGGYAFKISKEAAPPGSFGFSRIKNFSNIVGDWYYYH